MFTFVLVAKLQGTGCGYTNTERLFCNRITVFTRGNLERADTVDSESTYLGFPLIDKTDGFRYQSSYSPYIYI